MLGLTENDFYTSDRYSYLPAMTASLALAAALISLSRQACWIAGIAVVGALTVLAQMTTTQLRVWRDSPTLFARCIEVWADPQLTHDIYRRLADFHTYRGNLTAAAAVIARAERDGVPDPFRNEMAANLVQATEEIRRGAAPLVARLHGDLALQLAREGRAGEADEHFSEAVKLAPHSSTLRYNQALHAAAQGDARRALHVLLTATAQTNSAISVSAQRHGWAMISQAFVLSGNLELAAHASKRAASVADVDGTPSPPSEAATAPGK